MLQANIANAEPTTFRIAHMNVTGRMLVTHPRRQPPAFCSSKDRVVLGKTKSSAAHRLTGVA